MALTGGMWLLAHLANAMAMIRKEWAHVLAPLGLPQSWSLNRVPTKQRI